MGQSCNKKKGRSVQAHGTSGEFTISSGNNNVRGVVMFAYNAENKVYQNPLHSENLKKITIVIYRFFKRNI